MRSPSALLFAAVLTAAAPALSLAQNPDSQKPTKPADVKSFDTTAMDTAADPCQDFYQYACGNWKKNNPIPGDQVLWSRSISVLSERNRYTLWTLLEQARTDSGTRTPLARQYGDFYASCMDSTRTDALGIQPLEPTFARIAAVKAASDLPELLARLQTEGLDAPPIELGIAQDDKDSTRQIATTSQGGLSLPDRGYYLSPDKRFAELREQYTEHLKAMFQLAGDTPDRAAQEAAAVLSIETRLAQGSLSRTEMRVPEKVYHLMTFAQMQELTPALNWKSYLSVLPVGHFDSVNVRNPDFLKAVNEALTAESLDSWKSYLRWHAMHALAEDLSSAVYQENFRFFRKALAGQQQPSPRWRRCTALTDNLLGEAVGQDWVKVNFPASSKASMEKLVAALEKALAQDIDGLPWMGETTRKAALEKLSQFRSKIGYPDNWRDYSHVAVKRNDLVGNVERLSAFDLRYDLNKLGKPVDEKEWHMTPPTVNAYYSSSNNDINFPAGILQPPFFDPKADEAVNYGGIGVVIGHEMTHGFDDHGSKFDGHGNLREWQTAEDRKAFTERTDCEVEEYNGFEAVPASGGSAALNLNGKLTLGENTADNGGLRIAYAALLSTLAEEKRSIEDKSDGFTEAQRFFLSFGQVWCENTAEPESRRRVLTDPHSPGHWRINGVVRNFPEFGTAFHCSVGQPMMPKNICRVW